MYLPEQEQCFAAFKVENGHVQQLDSNGIIVNYCVAYQLVTLLGNYMHWSSEMSNFHIPNATYAQPFCSLHSSSNQGNDIPMNDRSGTKACGLLCSRSHKRLLSCAPHLYLTLDDSSSTPAILRSRMLRSLQSLHGLHLKLWVYGGWALIRAKQFCIHVVCPRYMTSLPIRVLLDSAVSCMHENMQQNKCCAPLYHL